MKNGQNFKISNFAILTKFGPLLTKFWQHFRPFLYEGGKILAIFVGVKLLASLYENGQNLVKNGQIWVKSA